jgi:hypothetical protein
VGVCDIESRGFALLAKVKKCSQNGIGDERRDEPDSKK